MDGNIGAHAGAGGSLRGIFSRWALEWPYLTAQFNPAAYLPDPEPEGVKADCWHRARNIGLRLRLSHRLLGIAKS